MDKYRFEYLIKTLSRTKRKDYENYVVNAIWNRLNDLTIKPASQWYVKNQSGWHLIDLYFPQINLGVECDEDHHKRSRSSDEHRELGLFEVLSAVNKHPYEAFHIDVTLSFDEIDQKINECVEKIKTLTRERRQANDFIEWTDINLSKHFKDQQIIHSYDDILFPTIASVVNNLMQLNKKSYQKGYFAPQGLDPQYKFWFPQLEINGQAQAFGWHNILSDDGEIITEYNDRAKKNLPTWDYRHTKEFLDYTRVVFAKVQDPITNKRSYKFVGVFQLKTINNDDTRTYTKIGNDFDANKHKIA